MIAETLEVAADQGGVDGLFDAMCALADEQLAASSASWLVRRLIRASNGRTEGDAA